MRFEKRCRESATTTWTCLPRWSAPAIARALDPRATYEAPERARLPPMNGTK